MDWFLNWAKNHLQAQLNSTNLLEIHPPNPLNRPVPINGRIIRELIFYEQIAILPNTWLAGPMPTPSCDKSLQSKISIPAYMTYKLLLWRDTI